MLTTSNWLLYLLCFISYYQSVNIDCKLPPVLSIPRHKSQLKNNHPAFTEKGECFR